MNLATVRLAHYYVGVFFAPWIIFFAFTGVLQVFKLHETYRQTPGAQGDWMPAGNYMVKLTVDGQAQTQTLTVLPDPRR